MEAFKSSDFKRNPSVLTKHFKEKEKRIVTDKDMYILVHSKFVDKELTILDNVCKVMGILAVVDEDKNYTIMTIPGMYNVEPSGIENIEIDGELYYTLHIEAGDDLISDTTVVKDSNNAYKVFDLFILSGKIPFFLEYEDLLDVFANLPKFAGIKLGKDTLPFEVFVAMVARDKNDNTKDYRLIINDRKDLNSKKPEWVGLMNIYYSFGSTLSKVAGSYFKTGTLAAIVNKNEKPTKLEQLLKA